ncbi:hypothetical protein [Paraburkholderia hospita]|uniref:hypothetical protein n=1 Tax=Paraburkholderia hospita TaxID=169430 RepID=UPI000B84C91A|nr:hypothetical protein [Paraburkholderia hospita]
MSLLVISQAASADTLSTLVEKQRLVMAHEMDKKLEEDPVARQSQSSAGQALSPNVTADGSAKKEAHPVVDDLRVNGIYGVNGVTTVDVSIGDGPSYPITKGRAIKDWTVDKVLPSSVTFRNIKTGSKKTIYLAEPVTTPASSTPPAMAGAFLPPTLPPGMSPTPLPRMAGQ